MPSTPDNVCMYVRTLLTRATLSYSRISVGIVILALLYFTWSMNLQSRDVRSTDDIAELIWAGAN